MNASFVALQKVTSHMLMVGTGRDETKKADPDKNGMCLEERTFEFTHKIQTKNSNSNINNNKKYK